MHGLFFCIEGRVFLIPPVTLLPKPIIMKKLLHTLLFAVLPIGALAQVTVSTSQYTSEQLVNDVLLSNSCYPATNITSSTGTNFSSVNGIGYFQNSNSDFPLSSGIILSNGDALNAAGPIAGSISGGSQDWPGDADIDNSLNAGTPYSSKNASVLEFDFTPLQDHISLDYIFASNEYGAYQCTWGDGVVFLLKDLTQGTNYINIAVMPGTTTPVCVSTIRSNSYNSACPSINSVWFGNYYADNPTTAPINFRGDTKVLNAWATVVPGNTYHLKIVLADKMDTVYDSAVFIDAGSLNIGAFDEFILSAQGDNICSPEGVTIAVYPALGTGFSYEWSKDGVVLSGETQSSLTPMTAGVYSVIVTHGATGCTETKSITIEAGSGLPIELDLTDLVVADENNDGFAIFDLTAIAAQIDNQTGQPGMYNVSFHQTQQDAEFGVNAIANPVAYANIVSGQQTLYALVYNDSGCSDVFSFDLIVGDIPEAPTGESTQTLTEGATLADLEVEGENILWYDNSGEMPDFPDGMDEPLPLSTVLTDGTTYYASQTIDGIESTQRLGVTVNLVLGVNEITFASLQYYPNPAAGILTIDNTNSIDTVSIANALGQKVFSKAINSNNAQVDISSLSKGVYFVTVTSGNASKTIKIIKE